MRSVDGWIRVETTEGRICEGGTWKEVLGGVKGRLTGKLVMRETREGKMGDR